MIVTGIHLWLVVQLYVEHLRAPGTVAFVFVGWPRWFGGVHLRLARHLGGPWESVRTELLLGKDAFVDHFVSDRGRCIINGIRRGFNFRFQLLVHTPGDVVHHFARQYDVVRYGFVLLCCLAARLNRFLA
uniref:Putative secreted protein n=1 Tax=Anopheles triannulatus TaxID=58253 RepID=A0A2M4B6G4_9DIPT